MVIENGIVQAPMGVRCHEGEKRIVATSELLLRGSQQTLAHPRCHEHT